MAKRRAHPKFMVEDLIIEGILAGVFRTCDQVELTPFGKWLFEPFRDDFDPGFTQELVAAVFDRAGRESLTDREFLEGFVDLALEPRPTDLQLLEALEAPPVGEKVLWALGAAAIQAAVFLCLCGVFCKEAAVKRHRLALEGGTLSRRSGGGGADVEK